MISRYLAFIDCFVLPSPTQKKTAIQEMDLLYQNALLTFPSILVTW